MRPDKGFARGANVPPRAVAIRAGKRNRLTIPGTWEEGLTRQTNWLKPGIEPTIGPITSSPAFSRP